MSVFSIFAVFITIAALASYINYKLIKFPTTVGLMIIGLCMSLALIGISKLGVDVESFAVSVVGGIDFSEALMKGMLSFLLFAGALKININDLFDKKYIISILATAGVLMTTVIVGTLTYYLVGLFGLHLPYM